MNRTPFDPQPYDVDPEDHGQVGRLRAAARHGDARARATVRQLDRDRKARREAERVEREAAAERDGKTVAAAKADYLTRRSEQRDGLRVSKPDPTRLDLTER